MSFLPARTSFAVVVAIVTLLVVPAAAHAATFSALLGEEGCQWYDDTPWAPIDHGCSIVVPSSVEADDIEDLAYSSDGAHLYLATGRGDIRRLDRDPATGKLTPAGCWSSSAAAGCTAITDTWWPSALQLSPDGRQLYVGTWSGLVTVLDRDTTTGDLTPRSAPSRCYGAHWSGCTWARIADEQITDIHITGDGSSLYVSQEYGSLVSFTRDTMTGALSQLGDERDCIGTWQTDGEGNTCTYEDEEIWGFEDAVTTLDGEYLYLATNEAILIYDRNPVDGTLTRAGCLANWERPGCTDLSGTGLWYVTSLTLSPDGEFLYAFGSAQLLTFDIDTVTGALTQLPLPAGCLERASYAAASGCEPLRGFTWGERLAISPDGTAAYATGDLGLSLFDRNTATGVLTQRPGRAGCITPYADTIAAGACQVAGGVAANMGLAVSPDGANVYAVGHWGGAIVTFGNASADCRDLTLSPARRNDQVHTLQVRCAGLDPDLRSLEVVAAPAHGTLTAVDGARGTFTYTPDAGWVGADSFTYRATDGVATTATRTVSLTLRDYAPPTWASPPVIVGTMAAGSTPSVDFSGATSPTLPLTSQYAAWHRCDGAGSNCSYVHTSWTPPRLSASDIGRTWKIEATVQNADGIAVAMSAASVPVSDPGFPYTRYSYVSGTARVGVTMTDGTTWENVAEPSTITRQWQSCNVDLSACSDIAGATGQTYLVDAADVGARLRLRSTITDARATRTATTNATSAVVTPPPLTAGYINVSPVIMGDAVTGSTLSVIDATFANGATPTQVDRQWRRCTELVRSCVDIAGATATSYTLTAADHGSRIVVFERLWVGTDYDWDLSDPTGEVRDAAQVGFMQPVATVAPSLPAPVVDTYHRVNTGTWDGVDPMTFAYQWERCDAAGTTCVDIAAPQGQRTYRMVLFEDIGATFRIRVTASNVDGVTTARSEPSAVVPEPVPKMLSSSYPTSDYAEGANLTVPMGTWRTLSAASTSRVEFAACVSGTPASSSADCVALQDSASSSLVIPASAIDRVLVWRVHATNSTGTGTGWWISGGWVRPAAPTILSPPVISGSATEGSTLTLTSAVWSASRPVVVRTIWFSCAPDGTACTGVPATGTSYVVRPEDEYRTIRVREEGVADAQYVDSAMTPALSDPTAVVPLQPPHEQTSASFRFYPGAPPRVGVGIGSYVYEPSQWRSPAPLTSSVQWVRCDSSGAGCVAITGATAAAYTPTSADIGSTLRLRYLATNAAGTSTHDTDATQVVVPYPPQAAWPYPSISGTGVEGATVTTTTGTFTSPSPVTYAIQWQQCDDGYSGTCTDIVGATGATLALDADEIGRHVRARITATNEGGSNVAHSQRVGPVQALPPVATGAPTFTGGDAADGSAVASGGTFSSSVPINVTYRWQTCATDGSDCADVAWGATLTVPIEYTGLRLRVLATGANGGGTDTVASALGPVITGPPRWSTRPYLYGSSRPGGMLTVGMQSLGTAPLAVQRTWMRCRIDGTGCVATDGRGGVSETLGVGDIGFSIRVRVRVSNAHGSISHDTQAMEVDGDRPVLMGLGVISGLPISGQVVRYVAASWHQAAWTSVRWQRCPSTGGACTDLTAAAGGEYVVTDADQGSWLRVVEQAGNGAGMSSATSGQVGPVRIDLSLIPVVQPTLGAVASYGTIPLRWRATNADGTAATVVVYERRARTTLRQPGARRQVYVGTGSSWLLRVAPTETVCASVAIMRDGVLGPLSPAMCTSGMQAASTGLARGPWQRVGSSRTSTRPGAMLSFSSRARVEGATIRLKACRTCGSVAVLWRGQLVRRVSLAARGNSIRLVTLPKLARPGPGTLTIRIDGRPRTVTVQGVSLRLRA